MISQLNNFKKMKSTFFILTTLLSLTLFACQQGGETQTDATESTATAVSADAPDVSGVFAIEAGSQLGWHGSKPVGKEHNGTIDLSSGSLTVANGVLTGGEFVIDMTTIKNIDVEDAEWNQKLVGHLNSDDFFGVETHPSASFKITSAEPVAGQDLGNYSITGDLTIKGITNEINFPAQITISPDGTSTSAKANLQFDRSKFDVKFGSTNFFEDLVGDKVISNEIDIELDFAAKAAQS